MSSVFIYCGKGFRFCYDYISFANKFTAKLQSAFLNDCIKHCIFITLNSCDILVYFCIPIGLIKRTLANLFQIWSC